MSNALILKKSGVADATPDFVDIDLGELAWNSYDGKLFGKTFDGVSTYAIVDLTLSNPEDIISTGIGLLGKNSAGVGPTLELSAAQARTLLNVADNADATGYRGNMGTTARDALTGLAAGQWIWNSDFGMRQERYDGSFWLGPRDIVLTNRTGFDSVYGKSWIVSPSYDFAIANPGAEGNIRVAGVVALGGVADGSPVVVTTNSVVADVLMQANDNTVRGYFIFVYANGENYSVTAGSEGRYGITLESKNDINNNYIIKALVGLPAETY